jgi:glycosyltransferase involved in cell wall biosynthesis
MNVLILSQAIGSKYLKIIYEALPKNSDVTLITGSRVDTDPEITIIKSPGHSPDSLISRLNCWLKYFFFLFWWAFNNEKKFDLIYATSNPPINAYIVARLLKKKEETKFVYMNWDIYPHIIEESFSQGFVKLLCKRWHRINDKIYKKVDKMITIGDTMSNSINAKLKRPIDIEVIPIATDTYKLAPIEKNRNPFSLENDMINKFIVLYSGKMGYGHNIPLILKAADKLKGNKDINFVFIGNGPGYKIVEEYIKDNNNPVNVKLFPLQPVDVFPFSMSCGDIGLVSQEAKLSHLFMPSKTYDMMSCGLAIIGICSGKDDLSHLIEKFGIGEYVFSNNPSDLAKMILKLYRNKDLLQKYKRQAREVAVSFYSKEQIIKKYNSVFKEVLKKGY